MKNIYFVLFAFFLSVSLQAQEKPRVLVLTDIENEPDDAMSLVRYLLYSNQFTTEGLVATTSIHQPNKIADWRILEILKAYGEVQPNLLLHETAYPSEAELLKVVKKGIPTFGLNGVGDEKDSEGSEWIIKKLKESERPLWVTVWGGANCLAQALYKIEKSESKETAARLRSRLRVYTISDQDNTGPWIRKNYPDVFYIVSPGTWKDNHDGYFYSTWSGIGGERHYNFAAGADTLVVDNGWVDENIQNHGPLGAQYPDIEYIMEGDSPSFMFLINNGLNSPENPNFGGWGGRYELYQPFTQKWFWEEETRPIWTNAVDKVLGKDGRYYADNRATIWRWRDHFQNDFAARMDWTIKGFKEANHPPVPSINTASELSLKSGESIAISAASSTDKDGDELSYSWMVYYEAGTNFKKATIENAKNSEVKFTAPKDLENPEKYHLILSLSDKGTPSLTRYKRIVITVTP